MNFNSQADPDITIYGHKQQSKLQRENDYAREAALAKYHQALADANHCTMEQVTQALTRRQRRELEEARKRAEAKMKAAACIQTSPINPETPLPQMNWEPRPPANVELRASDGSKVLVDKTRLLRLLGI